MKAKTAKKKTTARRPVGRIEIRMSPGVRDQIQRIARDTVQLAMTKALRGDTPAAIATTPKNRFVNLDAGGKPTKGEHVAVLDRKTGLVWSAGPLGDGKNMNHADAMQACKDLQLLGKKTWRAPSIEELLSIVDYARCEPAVATDHFKGPYDWTWSATVAPAPAGDAWSVYLHGGDSYRSYQSDRLHVRAVCASQDLGLSDLSA